MAKMMCDVVEIQGGFKPSVQLPRDFFDEKSNRHFIETYIPTEEIIDIFMRIRDSLQPNSENRAKLFTGTYGTGKSDLMLMIANYVTRPSNDPLLVPFFERLRALNSTKAQMIYDARLGKPPFLLVLLQADTASTFSSFIMDGLEKALVQSDQEDVLGKTYYRAARDLISFWEIEHPDNIDRLERELQDAHRMTLAQLKRDLAGLHADRALHIFSEATPKAIGMPFHPTAVIERPYEAFEMVSKALVESGTYSGIFVIADEFTHLLKKLAEETTASPDVKAIDNLAEMTARSGKQQVHFYVVSLEGFSSALASTHTSQVALERTGGRFIQGKEELRSQHMEELISASIVKKVSPKTLLADVSAQRDELLTIALRLWGNRATGHSNREWLQKTVVEGCFPLHPLTAYCLSFLNRQLAQNERTMFSFIWDEKYGLKSFIELADLAANDGWLNLLSLDRLFPYFEVGIKERRSDLYLLYQSAKSKLLPEEIYSGLVGRLLQVLLLLEITSGGSDNLRTDRELLRHALNLPPTHMPELRAALDRLEQEGIAYPSQTGYYRLVKQGQANPRELCNIIDRQAQKLILYPIKHLNEHYKPADVLASNYNKMQGTDRKLAASFVSVNDLAVSVSLVEQLQKIDGLLWYVVAQNEEEQLHARSVALQLTKQHDQLVIAVPLTPSDLIKWLRCKISLENLRYRSDYQRPDYQELLAANGIVGRDYLSSFQQARKSFDNSANCEWYFNGQVTIVQNPLQLEELVSRVMRTVFWATPSHKTAQHLAKGSKSAPKLREALDQILNASIRRSGQKSASATNAILFDGAAELGLIYFTEQEGGYQKYDVCLPDPDQHHHSRVIWDMLDERLKNTSVSLPEIIEELGRAPYSLYPQVIELFLAAFLRFNRDFTQVYTTKDVLSPKIDITSDTIIRMIENPKDYTVLYKPLLESQKEFLHEIECILLVRTEPQSSRNDVVPLPNRIAKLLRQKVREVLIVSQQPSLSELAKVLTDTPQEILTTCVQLIEMGQLADESSIATQLIEVLPQSLGLAADSATWTDGELQQAFSRTESAYRVLRQLSKRFRQLIVMQIGQYFGINEPPQNENEILKAALGWRKKQVPSVHIRDLAGKKDAQDLLTLLDDTPYNFEQVFLHALPGRWMLRPLEEWSSLGTREIYLERLERAKIAVDDQEQKNLIEVYKAKETAERLSTSIVPLENGQALASTSRGTSFSQEEVPTTDKRVSNRDKITVDKLAMPQASIVPLEGKQTTTSTSRVTPSSQEKMLTTDSSISTSKAVSQPTRIAEAGTSISDRNRLAITPATEYQPQDSKTQTIDTNLRSSMPISHPLVLEAELASASEKDPSLIADRYEETNIASSTATIEQAFGRIKTLFDSLPPRDQRKLWNLLVREYNPQ